MSSLSGVPMRKRRQLAATLGLFAVLLIAVGAVAATGSSSAAMRSFVIIALIAGGVVAVMAWGVALSVKGDLEQQQLDSAIAAAVAEHGIAGASTASCGCGHEHDPEELHVRDDPCGHDGQGALCSRTCDTCVFSRLNSTRDAETVGATAAPNSTAPNSTAPNSTAPNSAGADRPRPRPSR